MKKILVIEDDKIQAGELIRRLLEQSYKVRHISTELEFRKSVSEFRPELYSLAIVDMMLRWTDPSPQMERPPKKIVLEGFYNAGLRCCRELKENGVRSIIFTALDADRVKTDEFKVINKSRGFEALLQEVKRLSPSG